MSLYRGSSKEHNTASSVASIHAAHKRHLPDDDPAAFIRCASGVACITSREGGSGIARPFTGRDDWCD
jgi:hypothetical protein